MVSPEPLTVASCRWVAEMALWLLFTWNHIVFCCLFLAHFMAPVFQVNGTILGAEFPCTHPPHPPAPRRRCAVTFQTLSARHRSFVFFLRLLSLTHFYCHILLSIHFTGRMARSRGKAGYQLVSSWPSFQRMSLCMKQSCKARAMLIIHKSKFSSPHL